MTEYLLLLAFIFLVGFFCFWSLKNENKGAFFLKIVFLAIFLLCALRAPTVGRDLPGYRDAFLLTKKVGWDNYTYVYFENGYIFLMKLCVRWGLSFQAFIAVISAIILTPLYFYIKKYSKNPFLSVLIYICYVFFEFNMTGVRQAIASSIVLIGLMLFIESRKLARLKFLLLILLASLFHSGALVCLLFLPFSYIKKMSTYTLAVSVFGFLAFLRRESILLLIQGIFKEDKVNENAEIYIGLNFLFIFALAIYFIIANCHMQSLKKNGSPDRFNASRADEWHTKWFMPAIAIMLIFGMDTAVRSYMFFSQAIIVMLPNSISIWKKENQVFINMVVVVFFVVFFFINTLIPNNFDIVPYKFFWE